MTERRRLDESITATRTIERDLADTRELIELAEMEGDEALADDGVAALQALAAKLGSKVQVAATSLPAAINFSKRSAGELV